MFSHIPMILDAFETFQTLLTSLMFLGEAFDESLLHLSASFGVFSILFRVPCGSFVRSVACHRGAFQVLLAIFRPKVCLG